MNKTWKWFVGMMHSRDHIYMSSGTRVRTKYGRGVITMGSVTIMYEEGTSLPGQKEHPRQLSRTDNLNNIEIEVL